MKRIVTNYFSLSSASEFRGGREKTPVTSDCINIYIQNFEDPIFTKNDGSQEIWLEIVSINSEGKHIWFICPQSDFFYIIKDDISESFDSGTDFLRRLSEVFPEEFEFFIWYPKSIDGEWED